MGRLESTVYFANVRARSDRENKINKIQRLFDAAGLKEVVKKGDLTAIKLHFGERGGGCLHKSHLRGEDRG